MAEFLSTEWVAALDAAASAADELSDVEGGQLVLGQRVDLPDGSVRAHHLVLGPGPARVFAGDATRADVVLRTDLVTAIAIARGETTAQQELSRGTLRITGRLQAFGSRAATLAAVDDVFGAVRADTTYPESAPDGEAGARR